MTKDNQLQVINHVNGTALEEYQDRDVVRELAQRVMKFHPVFLKGKLPNADGLALQIAQLSILMGASPLPGLNEIHVYEDGRVGTGINYWQRRGEQKGGVYWDIEPRPMSESEREYYGITDLQDAAICRGVPMRDIREMRGLGFAIGDIVRSKGVIGLGTVDKKEYAKKGRPAIWGAIKRCKTDFYKTAFPYIPGEKMNAGAGMVQQQDGSYLPDYTSHQWRSIDVDAPPPDVEDSPFSDMSLDEMNDEWFGDGNGVMVQEDIQDGEFDEDEETAVTEPTNAGLIADIRAGIEGETGSMPLGDLVGEVIKTGEYADTDQVYGALKNYKFPARFKLVDAQTVTRAGALKIYDWLMEFAIGE